MSIQIVRQALTSVLGQNSKTIAPVALYTQKNRIELNFNTMGSCPSLFFVGTIELPKVANQSNIAQIFADFFATETVGAQVLINAGITLEVYLERQDNPFYKCHLVHIYSTFNIPETLAKQAEEVAQIQEAAELEAALLENSHSEPIAQVVKFTKHNGQKSCLVVKTLTNPETGETFPFSADFDSDFFCSPTSGVYVWGLYSVNINYTCEQLIFARAKTSTSAAKRETYYFDDESLAEDLKARYISSLDDFCYRAGIDPTEYTNIILGVEEPSEEPTTTAPEPTLPPAKKDPYLAEFKDSVESETNPEDLENSDLIITWGDYSVTIDLPLRFWLTINGERKNITNLLQLNPHLQQYNGKNLGYIYIKYMHESLREYHEKHYTAQGLQMYDCENTDSMFFAKLETAQKQVFAFNANGIALTGVFKYDADIYTYTVVGWDNTRKEPVIMKDPQRFLILETTTAGQYSCSFLSGQNHRSLPVIASQPNVRNTGLQTACLPDAINI